MNIRPTLTALFAICLMLVGCTNETLPEASSTGTVENSNFISMEEAQQDLMSILVVTDSPSSRAGTRFIINSYKRELGKVSARSDESVPPVYVFNFNDDNGFAIMASDRRMPSLIALAESGSLNEGDSIDNPGLGLFIDFLSSPGSGGGYGPVRWEWNDSLDTPGGASGYPRDVYGPWQTTKYISNACQVKWGQGEPYNALCPEKEGKKTLTGCTATALAQFMSIYQHPNDYKGYVFNWSAMTQLPFAGLCSQDAQNSIAWLMRQLGTKENLDVDYGVDGSGADKRNIHRTLSNCGFSNSGVRDIYNTPVVADELVNGYPILISAKSSKGRHTWLVHGLMQRIRKIDHYYAKDVLEYTRYEIEYYPLCNWGWEGRADGYYLSGVFDAHSGPVESDDTAIFPSTSTAPSGHNYNENVVAFYGIRQ